MNDTKSCSLHPVCQRRTLSDVPLLFDRRNLSRHDNDYIVFCFKAHRSTLTGKPIVVYTAGSITRFIDGTSYPRPPYCAVAAHV